MGLLDPKINKERTFELLRKKGAIKAELAFEGGHDQGAVETIMLTLETGEQVELPTWYCGGYGWDPDKNNYLPLSKPKNEDQELADLLEGPINEAFGSWGDVPSTEGVLVWDVFTGKAELKYSQERYQTYTEEVSL